MEGEHKITGTALPSLKRPVATAGMSPLHRPGDHA